MGVTMTHRDTKFWERTIRRLRQMETNQTGNSKAGGARPGRSRTSQDSGKKSGAVGANTNTKHEGVAVVSGTGPDSSCPCVSSVTGQ